MFDDKERVACSGDQSRDDVTINSDTWDGGTVLCMLLDNGLTLKIY